MAGDKVRSLKCFDELHDKVLAGVSVEDIAAWVQEEKQEYLDAGRGAVERAIYRYKKSIPAHELPDFGLPQHLWRRIEHLEGKLDALEEMEKLYKLQLVRIEKMMAMEDRMNGLTLEGIRKEMALAHKLLADRLGLEMKLGLRKKAPTELHLTGQVATTGLPQLENLNPEQKRRMGIIGHTLMEAIRQQLVRSENAIEVGEATIFPALPAGELGEGVGGEEIA